MPGNLRKGIICVASSSMVKKKKQNVILSCLHLCVSYVCVLSPLQLFLIAYDDGEPVKTNSTLVEITVLQPSRIPIFTQEEYRYISL